MSEIIAFENTNDYPVSFEITDIDGRRKRIPLWNKGDRIRDKVGNYIVPLENDRDRLILMGIRPVYRQEGSPDTTPVVVIKAPIPETPPNPIVVPEQQIETTYPRPAVPLTEKDKVQILNQVPVVPEVAQDSLTEGNPNPTDPDVVWKNSDGEWVYNGSGYKNANPAHLKSHVRAKYGSEAVERLKFQDVSS